MLSCRQWSNKVQVCAWFLRCWGPCIALWKKKSRGQTCPSTFGLDLSQGWTCSGAGLVLGPHLSKNYGARSVQKLQARKCLAAGLRLAAGSFLELIGILYIFTMLIVRKASNCGRTVIWFIYISSGVHWIRWIRTKKKILSNKSKLLFELRCLCVFPWSVGWFRLSEKNLFNGCTYKKMLVNKVVTSNWISLPIQKCYYKKLSHLQKGSKWLFCFWFFWIRSVQYGSNLIKLDQIGFPHQSKNVTIKSCHIYRKDKNGCLVFDYFASDLSKMDQTWSNLIKLDQIGFLTNQKMLL
jgi:hypothetical protein